MKSVPKEPLREKVGIEECPISDIFILDIGHFCFISHLPQGRFSEAKRLNYVKDLGLINRSYLSDKILSIIFSAIAGVLC